MNRTYTFEYVKPTDSLMQRRAAGLLVCELYGAYSAPSAPDPQDLSDQIEGQKRNRSLFIVHDRGKVVGAATTENGDEGSVSIKELATDRTRRCQGLGRILVRGIANYAVDTGNYVIDVLADAPAIPFYRNVGFEPVSPTTPHIMQAHVDRLIGDDR